MRLLARIFGLGLLAILAWAVFAGGKGFLDARADADALMAGPMH